MATTLQPSTNSELQLYRVLQRANLLQYFDTFITQGGDDVQQLCEAGEDEFLEIMALVGMASKPLHVRRLQKALQEWLANPTAFDVPKKFPTIVMSMTGGGGGVASGGRPGSTPSPMSSTEASLSPAHSIPSSLMENQQQSHPIRQNGNSVSATVTTSSTITNSNSPANYSVGTNHVDNVEASTNQLSQQLSSQIQNGNNSNTGGARPSTAFSGNSRTSLSSNPSPPWALQTRGPTPPEATAASSSGGRRGRGGQFQGQGSVNALASERPSPPDSPQEFKDVIKDGVYNPNDAAYIPSVSHPVLMDHQISAIAAAAAILSRDLPPIEPKSLPKKQNSKDITTVMLMNPDDPNRLDAMRKYAAIYGRFDSKRKNHRPMSLHEISVNEAAAQLCNHFPALLTRREELFPLARQVVRDSGYQYSKGHSRVNKSEPSFPEYECQNGLARAAEVLVQPKLEPLDHQLSTGALTLGQTGNLPTFVSTPGAVVMSAEDEAYSELQTELAHITLSLSEMDKEQARIRAALRVLLEANDLDQVRGLTAEMDVLNDRQEALAKRRQRIVTAMSRYKKGGPKGSGICERVNLSIKQQPIKQGSKKNNSISDNNNKISNNNNNIYGFNIGTSSINGDLTFSSNSNIGISNLSVISTAAAASSTATTGINDGDTSATNNPLNTLYLAAMQNQRDSLFEEGLRIATQYGMSDFAKELIGMKSQSKVLGSNDSGSGPGVSAPTSLSSHSSSAQGTASPVTSSLFSSSTPSTVASSSVAVLSADNISASSSEYLAPASGCPIHTPSAAAASASSVSVNTATSSSVQSSASLLFPSSIPVISSKQSKSPKSSKRSWHITSALATSSSPSIKSPRVIHTSSSSPSTSSAGTTKSQTAQEQDANPVRNIASPTPASAATTAASQRGSTSNTTISTKEVEPRRSSRRKNGEPDYYLINGGEKRFRTVSSGSTAGSSPGSNSSPLSRRSSSSDRRKVNASDGSISISSPSKPYTIDPCSKGSSKNSKSNSPGDNGAMRIEMSEMKFRNPAGEIHKVRMGFQQRFEPLDRDKR